MCILPHGTINLVTHMWNVMNQILKNFMFENIILFVNNIPIKSCKEEARDLILDADGCIRFIKDHIKDLKKILKELEDVDPILFIDKSKFGIDEMMMVRH